MAVSRKRFRKRRFKQMPYELAKTTIRSLGLTTRDQYLNWHHRTRPLWIPRYLPRVYVDEWEGWAGFLGTDNVFGPKRFPTARDSSNFLSYWEGVRLAQRLAGEYNIKTALEYRRWHTKNKANLDMLPLNPQLYYDEWKGWKVWLGKTIEGKLIGAKDAVEHIGILALVNDLSLPQNVVTIIKCPDGNHAFMQTLRDNNLKFVRAYQYSPEDEILFWKIINHFSKSFQGTDKERLCDMGTAQMISELDMSLLKVKFQ